MDKEQREKIERYRFLNAYAEKERILFTGSSLMEQFPVNELCMDLGRKEVVYNRGIGGFTTDDFLENIETVLFDLKPARIFINIGTNDIRDGYERETWQEHLFGNYEKIIRECRRRLPETAVYMMAYYPVNPFVPGAQTPAAKEMLKVRTNENIAVANRTVRHLAENYGCHYIDVNNGLTDETGNLKAEYTTDGVHMYPSAYRKILENLLPHFQEEGR